MKLFGFPSNFQSKQKVHIRKHTADVEAAVSDITIKPITDGEVVSEKSNDVDGNLLAEEFEAQKTFLPSSIIRPNTV